MYSYYTLSLNWNLSDYNFNSHHTLFPFKIFVFDILYKFYNYQKS